MRRIQMMACKVAVLRIRDGTQLKQIGYANQSEFQTMDDIFHCYHYKPSAHSGHHEQI